MFPGKAHSAKTTPNMQWLIGRLRIDTGVFCVWPILKSGVIFSRRFKRLLAAGDFDGLFVCLRSQSLPADVADQFGFNRPVHDEFLAYILNCQAITVARPQRPQF